MSENLNVIINQLREISEEIPHIKRDEKYTFEVAQSAFEKIEKLKPEIFKATEFMIQDQKLNKILSVIGESAIPYIKSVIYPNEQNNSKSVNNRRDDSFNQAISLLEVIGEPSISTLLSIFYSHEIKDYKVLAAHALININEDSQSIVRQALSTKKEDIRIAAVFGFVSATNRALWNNYFNERHIAFAQLLIPHLNDANYEIRERVLGLLLDLKRDYSFTEKSNSVISDKELIRIIDVALDDESSKVRRTALYGLLSKDINPSNAAILVKVLEDPNGQISNEVVDKMVSPRYERHSDVKSVTDAIINELVIRITNRPPQNFNAEIVAKALNKTFEQNPRLYGQTLEKLCDLAFEHQDSVRRRCIFVAKRINEGEFVALVHERADEDPVAAKAIFKTLGSGADADAIVDQISQTEPSDIQQNAANQIKLLEKYYEDGLRQAKASFYSALVITSISLVCLIATLYFLISANSFDFVSVLTAIGSILTQFIAGTVFYLYNQTRKQLTYYQQHMNKTQRFLLANSLVESLDNNSKNKTRIELVKLIASMDDVKNNLLSSGEAS